MAFVTLEVRTFSRPGQASSGFELALQLAAVRVHSDLSKTRLVSSSDEFAVQRRQSARLCVFVHLLGQEETVDW